MAVYYGGSSPANISQHNLMKRIKKMFFRPRINRNVITYIYAIVGFLIFGLAATANAQEAQRTKAVATFSILGDIVQNVAGERLDLSVLVAPGADSHVYSPSSADAKTLKQANIIFENGLEFEGWMKRLIKSSGTKAKVVVVSKGIAPLDAEDHESESHKTEKKHSHGHGHDIDPHAWQNVSNVKLYVANIRDALIELDPAGKDVYQANAKAYLEKLDQLDKTIRETIAKIPENRRKIITSHDAFAYFEAAYGVDFIGVQGVSSDAEASAKDVAKIIRQIKTENVPAIFVETISDPRLMEQISREAGVKIGKPIYSDSLSDRSGPASTYIAMMEYNLKAFSTALMPSAQ